MPYKKPLTNTTRTHTTHHQNHDQDREERPVPFATNRHQACGPPQEAGLAVAARTVAFVVWTAAIVLLAGIVAISVTTMLPPGPGGLVLIATVIGLVAGAPIIARRTFVRGLTAIEQSPDHRRAQTGHQDRDTRPAQESKAVVRQVYDAWNERDGDRVDALVAGDADSHEPVLAGLSRELAGETQNPQQSRSTFTAGEIDIDEMIAEGNTVAVRWTGTGTLDDSRMDSETTSTHDEVRGLGLTRVEDGQIVDSWGVIDTSRGDDGGR